MIVLRFVGFFCIATGWSILLFLDGSGSVHLRRLSSTGIFFEFEQFNLLGVCVVNDILNAKLEWVTVLKLVIIEWSLQPMTLC